MRPRRQKNCWALSSKIMLDIDGMLIWNHWVLFSYWLWHRLCLFRLISVSLNCCCSPMYLLLLFINHKNIPVSTLVHSKAPKRISSMWIRKPELLFNVHVCVCVCFLSVVTSNIHTFLPALPPLLYHWSYNNILFKRSLLFLAALALLFPVICVCPRQVAGTSRNRNWKWVIKADSGLPGCPVHPAQVWVMLLTPLCHFSSRAGERALIRETVGGSSTSSLQHASTLHRPPGNKQSTSHGCWHLPK